VLDRGQVGNPRLCSLVRARIIPLHTGLTIGAHGMSRILVVDDDAGLRNALHLILSRIGHEVDMAVDGTEALARAVSADYDAAVVDYRIPPPDGLDVLNRLRDIQPTCVRLLMSGTLDLPVLEDAVNRGEIARVIRKPFDTQSFVTALDGAITGRARLRDVYIGAMRDGFDRQRRQLEECLSSDTLTLALQPIVHAGDSAVAGYEALLRSKHPAFDTPLALICAAESQDMLGQLADRVAERAARILAVMPADLSLFINAHPAELSDADAVRRRFERLRPWAERVVIEITERTDVLQIMHWDHAVDFLTGAGFRIAVDDLGAGYNSLSVLAELHPAFAKVDMTIVRNIDSDMRKQRLVELLAHVAKATQAQLIVEGVETAAEAAVVRRLGADYLQGFLFGHPVTDLLG
jgi:EAL domain-containing protein (putative c-di-GMP-specific phosphodiesterase class I)/ActR/RegA family two-component response regulator